MDNSITLKTNSTINVHNHTQVLPATLITLTLKPTDDMRASHILAQNIYRGKLHNIFKTHQMPV
jgi:hypothetical protein